MAIHSDTPLQLQSAASRGRSLLAIAAIGVLVLCSGCLGFGTSPGQTGPVDLHIVNDGNTTHEFSIWVADGELGRNSTAIYRADRPVSYASPGQGLSTYTFTNASGAVTAVEVPANRSRSLGTHRLAPGERYETNVTDFETGDTLVVVDRRGDRIVSLITANCDETGLNFVSVIAGPVRTSAAYSCI